ncbi:hypothetical protein ORJ04_18160 [Rheinheimera baltica]|uniref:Uncharacterized protein n=1 Tax=Rheinheimera baltica TaxID=67576 RepID=A0ABT9I4F7_9GAMM|nr:hypothetical protein [Rheinheimera baltica]MDP5137880.1 hypothetical protein [Rheinheimera baltica]MDP5149763.1 hypothetical protein [Rheinheimera baltica]
MKRVCILGNSHAACWLLAWKTMQRDNPNYQITFFMVGGYELGKLIIEQGKLVARSEKLKTQMALSADGLTQIDPSAYDAFVIVSLTFGYRNLTPLFKQCCSVATGMRSDNQLISDALMQQSVDDILTASLALKLASQLRQISNKLIVLAPAPCQSEDALLTKDRELSTLLQRPDILHNYYTLFATGAKSAANTVKAKVLFQPDNTLSVPGYTKRQFARGGINSTLTTVAAEDVSHMNTEFGALMLVELILALQQY